MKATQFRSNERVVHLVLTYLGVTGIAGLFLPFVYGVSPVAAVFQQDLWLLAYPFFLAPLAVAASLRWIMSGSFSRVERALAYLLSGAMVAGTALLYVSSGGWPEGIHDWLTFFVPPMTLVLGAYVLFRNSRKLWCREFNPVLAMETAYLANVLLCLIAFFRDWQVGAYFVLVAASVFVLQIILVSVQRTKMGLEAHA
jgi:hypothetical protein